MTFTVERLYEQQTIKTYVCESSFPKAVSIHGVIHATTAGKGTKASTNKTNIVC